MKVSFKLLLLICATLTAVSLSAQDAASAVDYTHTKDYELGGVQIEGTKHLDQRVLLTLSGLTVGDKIKVPGEDIANAIKKLWKQRLFTDVEIVVDKIEGDKIFLTILVEERPRLARYNIKGVKASDVDELKKKLDVRAGSIFTDNIKMAAVHTIKHFFIEKGYLNVNVEVKEIMDTVLKNSVTVQFFVDKGEVVKIKEIIFEGNKAYSNVQLRSKMKDTKEKPKFDIDQILKFRKNFETEPNHPAWYQVFGNISPTRMYEYLGRFVNPNIFKASRFKRKEYEEDKQKVIDFLQSKGYRDAHIISDSVYRIDAKNLGIRIKIDEGHPYYFRNIEWRGNTKYSDSLLSRILDVHKGDLYSAKALEAKLYQNPNGGDISSLYMDDGYLFFNVTPTEIKVDGDSIDVAMVINEGAQATIRDVRIMGNTKTNEQVIRRELYTLPGSKFSRSDLIRSQRQISNLGYFDPQQMDVVPIPNPENGTVDIEYRVTEKPSDQLELSAGYGGSTYGFVGTLGVTFSNFSVRNIFNKKAWSPLPTGDGQRLSVRFQSSGKPSQFYTVAFTEPWLGGRKPTSLTVSFNRSQLNNLDYNTVNYPVIGMYAATAASVAIGTRLKAPDDFFTLEAALNYTNYSVNNYPAYFTLFDKGQSNNINFSLNISRTSVDAPLYPKHGSIFSLTAIATLPYSYMFPGRMNVNYSDPDLPAQTRFQWLEYFKVKLKVEWYTSIWQNLVLKASAKMGFIGAYNPKVGVSPFERFQVGGDGISNYSIIGKDMIALRGYPIISSSDGATIFNKYFVELRYPISLNPSATIFVLVFAEAGNVWYDFKSYRPYQLNRSLGIGVRVFLPMFGLLGVDYGFPLDILTFPSGNASNPKGAARIVLGQESE